MRTLNILLIDDEPRWINFAKNNPGIFNIAVASDVETALQALANDQFDLVIASALHFDALNVIRETYAEQPMLVTTVEPTSQEARNAYRLGARRYFAKSFNYTDLEHQIRHVIPTAYSHEPSKGVKQ